MAFWSSLDHLLEEPSEMQGPNPLPPLGSGKKARPPMLLIPDFNPPPPSPSPLNYLFQLPHVVSRPVWNPAPERKRRPKVWDVMPNLPAAVQPQQRLCEPRAKTHKAKVSAPPMTLPRQSGRADLKPVAQGNKSSPSSADVLEQIMGHSSTVLHFSTSSHLPRRSRDGLHCGVDLSALWGALVDFVFSPASETASHCPCASSQRALHTSDAAVRCTVEEEVAVEPKFASMAQEAAENAFLPGKAPLRQQSSKGIYSSPMSVLTPLSTEKSSADSSPWPPHSLLAFVGNDSSP